MYENIKNDIAITVAVFVHIHLPFWQWSYGFQKKFGALDP